MIVVDASVLAPALADDGASGERARAALAPHTLTAPDLLDLEVVSVFRGQVRAGKLSSRRAASALRDLHDLPLERVPHRPLLARCWELRANVTSYDAAYLALAEVLSIDLVTADARLARVPGARCRIDLVSGTAAG